MIPKLWNESSLSSPPVTTYKASDNSLDTTSARRVIDEALTLIDSQQPLHKDAAILSRLHYRMGTKFRHDIGYSSLRKTHVALLKYVNFNLKNALQTFADVLSENVGLYLPTRQMLEYILIRLQTFSKLLYRIISCSRMSATFFLDRIKRGDAWWLSVMPYAVLSRIWYAARHLLKNVNRWYVALRPLRDRLKVIGVAFVPPEYIFPNNLIEWLDMDNLIENGQSWIYKSVNVSQESSITDVSLDQKDENKETINNEDTNVSYANRNAINCDMGEIISRETYNHPKILNELLIDDDETHLENKQETKAECELSNFNFEKIKNVETFKKIFETEDVYRSTGDSRSKTSHLSLMQWESLKTVLNKLILKSNSGNEKITLKKIKRTWTERCSV